MKNIEEELKKRAVVEFVRDQLPELYYQLVDNGTIERSEKIIEIKPALQEKLVRAYNAMCVCKRGGKNE